MSPDSEDEKKLSAENEELHRRIGSLENELQNVESQLQDALRLSASAGASRRSGASYLAWVFWMVLVACLGAYLYRILAGAGGPSPEPSAPTVAQPPVPSSKTKPIRPAPEKSEPAPSPAKLPGFND